MKRFCASIATMACAICGSALASDLPPPPPYVPPSVAPVNPYTPVSVYNWTGVFVGGHVGYGLARENASLIGSGTSVSSDASGFLVGAQVGFNYQFHNWVVGAGADWSWTNADNAAAFAIGTGTSEIGWYGTVFVRSGYAVDNWLFYLKAGAAWMAADYTAAIAGTTLSTTISDTRIGWLAGLGLEWGFWHNWSGFAEYNYIDFGTERYAFTFAGPFPTATIDIKTQVHLFKIGTNVRFGGGPLWP